MFKLTVGKVIVFAVLILLIVILVSTFTAYLIARSQTNIRFVAQPRENNESYGYLEVNGNRYYQLYTTMQDNIGNGLHIHRIDLRSSNPQE